MTTFSSQTSVNATAALEYATGGNYAANMKATYDNIVNNSEFRVLALGGNARDTAEIFKGKSNGVLNAIAKGLPFSPGSPAYPISYKVRDLKDKTLATM